MKKITIEFIEHKFQRYNTPGDYWYDENGDLQVRVSDLGDCRMNTLVAIHEVIEELTSKNEGITEQEITDFDIMFEKEREGGLWNKEAEPGNDRRSPYRRFHKFSTKIEKMVCRFLKIKWEYYEAKFNTL